MPRLASTVGTTASRRLSQASRRSSNASSAASNYTQQEQDQSDDSEDGLERQVDELYSENTELHGRVILLESRLREYEEAEEKRRSSASAEAAASAGARSRVLWRNAILAVRLRNRQLKQQALMMRLAAAEGGAHQAKSKLAEQESEVRRSVEEGRRSTQAKGDEIQQWISYSQALEERLNDAMADRVELQRSVIHLQDMAAANRWWCGIERNICGTRGGGTKSIHIGNGGDLSPLALDGANDD